MSSGDTLTEKRDPDGFLDVVCGAAADSLDCSLGGVVGGHQDDIDGGVKTDDLVENVKSAHAGHHEVSEHEARAHLLDQVDAFMRLRGEYG